MKEYNLHKWADILHGLVDAALSPKNQGNIPYWTSILKQLPQITRQKPVIHNGVLTFKPDEQFNIDTINSLEHLLRQLHPWRKGPYSISDIYIDTEWRSDYKWDRLCNHIQPLKNKRVLDVGCGNGYHCWRMVLEGASFVVGIDPYILSIMQFYAINHFSLSFPLWIVPIGIEEIPQDLDFFDTVFSMGVLYHRRSPFDHLYELAGCLHSTGELILETLVIEGKKGDVLVPEGRYGKMRNVWFIPSALTLESWLKRCKFKNIRCVSEIFITEKEQRTTSWMKFESLPDFLNPENKLSTIEGYPAPRRAILIAEKP
jgi:tRNA (mo5U34)-methyltransferase